MTRDEFKRWLGELRKRLPDTHRWLAQQGADTAAVWFDDVFSGLEYDVAFSALQQVWSEGIAAYDREKLPAIIAKKHSEIVWHRGESQRKAEEARQFKRHGFFSGEGEHYVSMRRCYVEYRKLLQMDMQTRGPGFVNQYFDLQPNDPERCDTAAEYAAKYSKSAEISRPA